MKHDAPPLTRFYDLDRMGPMGDTIALTATPEELARLAEWAAVDRVLALVASITLRRLSPVRYRYHAELEADLVQSCVVTLEPVASHIERVVERDLHLVKETPDRGDGGGMVSLTEAEDEVPEEIVSPHFDLAGPLREELSLAIDPYPRAAGVVFDAPDPGERADEGPFAVLKRLKKQG